MLSMLPSGSTSFLYQGGGVAPPPGAVHNKAPPPQSIHPDHVHFRSASMPESVYLHRVAQIGVGGPSNPPPPPPPYYPVKHHPHVAQAAMPMAQGGGQRRPSNGLRRSATNVADFAANRRHPALTLQAAAAAHQMPKHPAAWGSNLDLNGLAARSRTNIAAIAGMPGGGGGPPHPHPQDWPPQGAMPLPRRHITRATSFYHPQAGGGTGQAKTTVYGSAGQALGLRSASRSVLSKDVSKPLHVDCSIEYDLGAQPKIPKDSAPLLIIHPDYLARQQQQLKDRFHPYTGSSSSPMTSRQQHNDVTSRTTSVSFRTPANNVNNSATRFDKNLTRSAPTNKIARHQSFAVASTSAFNHHRLTHHQNSSSQPYDKRLSLARSSHNLNGNLLRSNGRIGEDNNGLHLSMPDISMDDDDDDEDDEELARYHEIATRRRHQQQQLQRAATTSKKSTAAQHPLDQQHHGAAAASRPVRRGVSMASNLQRPAAFQRSQGHPKARINLSMKLEAARKPSTEEHHELDVNRVAKGASPPPPNNIPSNGAHNYSFEFKELSGDHDQGFESFTTSSGKPVNVHPVRHLAAGTSNTFCDSGLGTPSSLIGDTAGDTPDPRRRRRHQQQGSSTSSAGSFSTSGISSSNTAASFIGNSLNRWKSSVSGLVTGFMCCAPSKAAAAAACSSGSGSSNPAATPASIELPSRPFPVPVEMISATGAGVATVAHHQDDSAAFLTQQQQQQPNMTSSSLAMTSSQQNWNGVASCSSNFGSSSGSGSSSTSGVSSNSGVNGANHYGYSSPEADNNKTTSRQRQHTSRQRGKSAGSSSARRTMTSSSVTSSSLTPLEIDRASSTTSASTSSSVSGPRGSSASSSNVIANENCQNNISKANNFNRLAAANSSSSSSLQQHRQATPPHGGHHNYHLQHNFQQHFFHPAIHI